MTWYTWLILAMIIAVAASVTGIKPSGTRHVARTSLMSVARFVLLCIMVVFVFLAFRARAGQ